MQRYQLEQSSWPVSLSSWIHWCWLCQLWQGETVIGVDSMPLHCGHYPSLPQGWCNDKLEHWSYLNDSACQCQMLCSEEICSVGISESKTFSCWCSGIQKTIWAGWRNGSELWLGWADMWDLALSEAVNNQVQYKSQCIDARNALLVQTNLHRVSSGWTKFVFEMWPS